MGESKENNDLFFTCSLLEYIARKTNNKKKYVVEKIGKERIKKIYDLADVYHCEDINKVSDELILSANIKQGDYELKLNNKRPSFWELGRIYQKLILMIDDNKDNFIDNLFDVMISC